MGNADGVVLIRGRIEHRFHDLPDKE
jgi:hypothetical protein